MAIPEDEWPEENAPSTYRPQFPPRPTLPDWVDENFRTCIGNLFPDRNANNFDTLEQCFEGTSRDDFAEAVNCAYCGLDAENRDFVYAFCNATGTLQEDQQVLTCENFPQSRNSALLRKSLSREENDDTTINISWTTGND